MRMPRPSGHDRTLAAPHRAGPEHRLCNAILTYRRGGELPRLNPSNPKYRLAVAAWQKLPLPVANWLGPHLVKNLP